jgi:hypothetical protein
MAPKRLHADNLTTIIDKTESTLDSAIFEIHRGFWKILDNLRESIEDAERDCDDVSDAPRSIKSVHVSLGDPRDSGRTGQVRSSPEPSRRTRRQGKLLRMRGE